MSSTLNPTPMESFHETKFDCGTRLGVMVLSQSALVSCVSVLSLLSYIIFKLFTKTNRQRLFRSHLDIYFTALLFSDLVQSIGGVMKFRWVHLAGVTEGPYCITQGIMEQFGDVGVALWYVTNSYLSPVVSYREALTISTIAIAAHTFAELILRWQEPKSFLIPNIVISAFMVFLSLITSVGYASHRGKDYYGDTTYWCWIRKNYVVEGLALEYVWLWSAALLNLLFYLPVFLVLRRILVVEPSTLTRLGYEMRFTSSKERRSLQEKCADAVEAHRMLFYPAVYIVTVVPIGASRIPSLVSGSSTSTPLSVVSNSLTIRTVICSALFEASGFFNVVVYTFTRPALRRISGSEVSTKAPKESLHINTQKATREPEDGGIGSVLEELPHIPYNLRH